MRGDELLARYEWPLEGWIHHSQLRAARGRRARDPDGAVLSRLRERAGWKNRPGDVASRVRCGPRRTHAGGAGVGHGGVPRLRTPGSQGMNRVLRAPRGTQLSCRSWLTEAALRMLMNNLDPEVAERPQELVVYGGIGKAARNWEC